VKYAKTGNQIGRKKKTIIIDDTNNDTQKLIHIQQDSSSDKNVFSVATTSKKSLRQ
jgi:hypothetical protein